MAYQSFTLKYRPKTFEDIVGQEHVSRALRNALAHGTVAHGYLFTGPRGTGKTTTARVLARGLNCVNGPTATPCGVCGACVDILEGRAMDVIEMDAASNRGIDDIRDLREKVKYAPAEHRCKLYILDECHALTKDAWNALLKTLEEPPPHVYFALLTTEAHNVPATILSRCQRFDFRPISLPDQVRALRQVAELESVTVSDEALAAVARAAEGAMRDAESIFEQVVAFSDGEVTLATVNAVLGVTETESLAEVARIVARRDLAAAFDMVDRLVAQGKDLGRLIEDLTVFFRDLLRAALGSQGEAWMQLGAASQEQMRQLAASLGPDRLLGALNALAELRGKLKASSQHGLLLEMALVGLIRAPSGGQATAPPPQPVAEPVRPAEAPPPPAAPVAPPEPAPPPPGEPTLSLDTVLEHWEAVGVQLRRMGQVPVAAFLKEAVPIRLQGDCLTIAFPPQFRFHYTKVKDDYAETVAEALSKLFRRPVRLVCELAESEVAAPSQAAAAPPAEMPAPTPPAAEAPPPAREQEAAPPTETAAEPAGLTADEAVSQTLSLFEGAEEIKPGPAGD